jgi:two-component system phosphate regulon sensor histidine kinase PhoR
MNNNPPRISSLILAGMVVVLTVAVVPMWFFGRRELADPASFDRTFLWIYVLSVMGMSLFSLVLSRVLVRSAAKTSEAAEALARGQLSPDAALKSVPVELGGILESVDRYSAEMRARMAALEAERHGLTAILGAMEEGLLVVDSQKQVLMANHSARRILNLPDTELEGRLLQELTRQQDLLANIDLSISESQTCNFEFKRPGTNNYILARCAPFRDDPKSLNGAVAVLHDISELRRLERMRTEFVANVSHELRTPLTSLMGYLETLQEGLCTDPEQVQQFLNVCRRQSERLSGIVEDLLRLSRLENPMQEMAVTVTNLEEVVGLAVEQSRSMAEQRGITLELDLPGRDAMVLGDRGLLVQAISNLIENAINYNRENGRVTVKLAQSPGAALPGDPWEIAVSDTGIGIPMDALNRIFERFYRVDKARSRQRGGTGLGLAIVKHIALAHGASVHVESELDKGSTFRLRFPKKREKESVVDDKSAKSAAPDAATVRQN